MKYCVIGTGAMGLRYGVLMQELAGCDVDFIDAWQPQLDKVKEQGGVFVKRDHQNRHLVKINLYSPADYPNADQVDCWIVFMKQMQLEDMLAKCAHLFKRGQTVVSCMNGMGHVEKLQKYFDDDHLIAGTAMIATVLDGPGEVDFIGAPGAGYMHMGYPDGHTDETIEQIAKDFEASNLNPTISDNFMGMLMTKVIFNSVVNTLCTMYEIKMGQFIQSEAALPLAKQLIDEAYDACERAGIYLLTTRQEELASVETVSRVGNPEHYPSMYQDFSKNRPTEVDYINGYIAKLGAKNGYRCAVHEFLTNAVHLAELARTFHAK